ncbi:MAG: hypothetical protein Q8P56_07075 [Candidatus Uhrbacteria bacterium]|nr:hypothetical protein [Candidatus Uhrbacteria bacterium]
MKNRLLILELKKTQTMIESCILALSKSSQASRTIKSSRRSLPNLNFSLNERHFVKTNAKGMGSPQKFALLLARITKGKTEVDVPTKSIEVLWNKMTAKDLLGCSYNSKYSTAAKTNGWVDSRKYGTYHISNSWKEIFD